MNPAMLAVMPTISPQTPVTAQTSTSSSTGKFGAVLESALSTGLIAEESELGQGILSANQIAIIEDVLHFLGIDSLAELEGGSEIGTELLLNENLDNNDSLLQLLLKLNSEDETVVKEFLVSIVQVNERFEMPAEAQDMKEILNEILPDIYAALKQLDALDVKGLASLDLNGAANLLKLAKLQELVASHQDLTQDQAEMSKEIKHLLESIAGKLQKWLSTESPKAAADTSFAAVIENGTNKSLDVVKQAYVRFVTSDGESSEETVSNGLTLKTAEANTQSSSLPFQMTKLEQFVLNTSKTGQAVDAEQFVKSFENILSKANFSKANGVQKLLIRLNPEHLGSLRIELIQKEGTMVAKILATTAQAKELLDRQLQGLKQAFTNQSIQVEKIEISQQISTFNSERFTQRDPDANKQQGQQLQQNESKDDAETDFTDSFAEALLNIEV
ncbi:flagellar hook-length control protein FliK [Peribacillus asahii]|uniref:flagellar hook-length control protein FliK n=1 Tax=Peribacillus asahii TaxID=228899 RepID=UPI002079D7D5|nr:flagellar hook-length control protein FliK [Peribacillus asahii]USK71646.1 flagellar hook-length control protein FliK [Peribacillus asahii]